MSFIESIIGERPENIGITQVQSFFASNPRESQHLEFKSGDVELLKIQKEICAFLNSEGGLLVLGAPREGDETFQPDLNHFPDSNLLLNQIANGIDPTPPGIKIYQIAGDDGSIFLVEVPQSQTPPHQLSGSGVYYMREAAVSRPAKHHEVERLILQRRKASLDLKIEIERPDDALLIRLIIGNSSSISAYEPGFNFACTPMRSVEGSSFQQQQIAKDNYLAEGQQWVHQIEVFPAATRFFMHCQYYCRDVAPKTKAAFAEIINNKVDLLSIYNSEMHSNYDLWYEENLYLLQD